MRKIVEIFKTIVLLVFLAISLPVLLVAKLFEKPIVRTPEEVLEELERMAAREADEFLWDNFLSVPIKNRELDKIREKVEVLWAYEEFQEKNEFGEIVLNKKGLTELEEIINVLRRKIFT